MGRSPTNQTPLNQAIAAEPNVATVRDLLAIGCRSIGSALAQQGVDVLDAAIVELNRIAALRDALPPPDAK